MTPQERLKSVTSELSKIPENVKTCHDVALALIEANEKVSYAGTILALIVKTEYDRARKQIITTCSSTLRGLKAIRRTALSPDAIRATTCLNHVLECCRECPSENLENMQEPNHFSCPAKEASEDGSMQSFHFALDRKGRIIERE